MHNLLTDLASLELHDLKAEVAEFQGQPALRLENGLALLSDFKEQDFSLEVWIAAEGACYAGLAFRLKDTENYELAYALPHASGRWDALQYDPVFNHSNTWQVFHGPCYQQTATIPTRRWFKLHVDALGERAAVSVDDQPPLIVEKLAYEPSPGKAGLWTYLPAYFRDLRIFPCSNISKSGRPPAIPEGAIEKWHVKGEGEVGVEPNGALNLNRWLTIAASPAHLTHHFSLAERKQVEFAFGFSDSLALAVDGQPIFQGENLWQGMQADYFSQGYIIAGQHHAALWLDAGPHELAADLAASEGFGWGIACQIA